MNSCRYIELKLPVIWFKLCNAKLWMGNMGGGSDDSAKGWEQWISKRSERCRQWCIVATYEFIVAHSNISSAHHHSIEKRPKTITYIEFTHPHILEYIWRHCWKMCVLKRDEYQRNSFSATYCASVCVDSLFFVSTIWSDKPMACMKKNQSIDKQSKYTVPI